MPYPNAEVSKNYIVETYVDQLPGGAGGMSIRPDGHLFVADFGALLGGPPPGGTQVFQIRPDGSWTVFANGLQGASGNEIDKDGNLFQSNIRGHFIAKIAPNGQWTEFVHDGIKSPVGIVIDPDGNLFVSNCGADNIQKVTTNGESSLVASESLLSCPNGITIDENRNLYVSNFNNGDVLKITPDAVVSRLATLPGDNNGHLTYHAGYLYVIDRGSHSVYRISLDGKVELFAGTGQRGHHNGRALQATFSYPNDIVVGEDGSFYVNENGPTTGPHTVLAPMMVRRIRPVPEANE